MKVLIVSHPCATSANQAIFAKIRQMTGWDVRLVIPSNWQDEFGNSLVQPDWQGLEGRVTRASVLFNGNIILHGYRMGWSAFLRREAFDVIYMHHEPYALATGQVCLANSRQKSPAAFGFYSAQNILKSYPPPFPWIERFVHHRARFAFPVSTTVADVLAAKKSRAKATICPLPVDSSIYFPRGHNPTIFSGAPGQFTMGYVGRIVEPKGLGTLALALEKIKDLPWTLQVIGSGDFQPAFEHMLRARGIHERVVFLGFVPHLKTPEYLSAMDLLVVPSETQQNWKEQFGRVIVEALACGTPVVGSDSGEIPVLIGASGGGMVFPERNPQALADAIRSMIEHPERRIRMAEAGKVWVTSNATLEVVAQRMVGAMEDAVR